MPAVGLLSYPQSSSFICKSYTAHGNCDLRTCVTTRDFLPCWIVLGTGIQRRVIGETAQFIPFFIKRAAKERALSEQERLIAELRAEVDQNQRKLGVAQGQIKASQTELARTGRALEQVRSQLGQAQSQLVETQTELGDARSQLGQTQEELEKQKAATGLVYTISQENLRSYCRSLGNEVTLARNSLQNLQRLEVWMRFVEYQMRVRMPSAIWDGHRSNLRIAGDNLQTAQDEQQKMASLCQAVQ